MADQIPPVSLSSASGEKWADDQQGNVTHFGPTSGLTAAAISNPTEQLANRDNILATKLNDVVAQLNNRDQFISLPIPRTTLPPASSVTVANVRIPDGFEARVLNAIVASTPNDQATLEIRHQPVTFGGESGTTILATCPPEFNGGTDFYPAGELVVIIANDGTVSADVSASVTITMRSVGAVTGGLLSKGTEGKPGLPGPQGLRGPIGPIGPPGLVWRGAWSPTATYVCRDVVSYPSPGVPFGTSSWVCVVPPPRGLPGAPPSNPVDTSVYWELLAEGYLALIQRQGQRDNDAESWPDIPQFIGDPARTPFQLFFTGSASHVGAGIWPKKIDENTTEYMLDIDGLPRESDLRSGDVIPFRVSDSEGEVRPSSDRNRKFNLDDLTLFLSKRLVNQHSYQMTRPVGNITVQVNGQRYMYVVQHSAKQKFTRIVKINMRTDEMTQLTVQSPPLPRYDTNTTEWFGNIKAGADAYVFTGASQILEANMSLHVVPTDPEEDACFLKAGTYIVVTFRRGSEPPKDGILLINVLTDKVTLVDSLIAGGDDGVASDVSKLSVIQIVKKGARVVWLGQGQRYYPVFYLMGNDIKAPTDFQTAKLVFAYPNLDTDPTTYKARAFTPKFNMFERLQAAGAFLPQMSFDTYGQANQSDDIFFTSWNQIGKRFWISFMRSGAAYAFDLEPGKLAQDHAAYTVPSQYDAGAAKLGTLWKTADATSWNLKKVKFMRGIPPSESSISAFKYALEYDLVSGNEVGFCYVDPGAGLNKKLDVASWVPFAFTAVGEVVPVTLPTVTTLPFTGTGGFPITLYGNVLSPEGATVYFQYRRAATPDYAFAFGTQLAANLNVPQNFNASFLSSSDFGDYFPGTQYYFRAAADSYGNPTQVGAEFTFTTAGTAPPSIASYVFNPTGATEVIVNGVTYNSFPTPAIALPITATIEVNGWTPASTLQVTWNPTAPPDSYTLLEGANTLLFSGSNSYTLGAGTRGTGIIYPFELRVNDAPINGPTETFALRFNA